MKNPETNLLELIKLAKNNEAGLSHRRDLVILAEEKNRIPLRGMAIHMLDIVAVWDEYFARETKKGSVKTPEKFEKDLLGLLDERSIPVFKQILILIAQYDGPPAKKKRIERVVVG